MTKKSDSVDTKVLATHALKDLLTTEEEHADDRSSLLSDRDAA